MPTESIVFRKIPTKVFYYFPTSNSRTSFTVESQRVYCVVPIELLIKIEVNIICKGLTYVTSQEDLTI
jgi:hypothetical protein